MAGVITAWSASRLSTWEQCPKKARYLYVEKRAEPKSAAMQKGTDIHKQAEAYMQDRRKGAVCPPALSAFATDLTTIRAEFDYAPEEQYALDKRLNRVEWFDPAVWLRAIVDLRYNTGPVSMGAVDYKTGKIREKDAEQMELYALVLFAAHPEVRKIRTRLWYTEAQVESNADYERGKHYRKLVSKWRARSVRMLMDQTFEATPSVLCKWCAFSSRYGAQKICKEG